MKKKPPKKTSLKRRATSSTESVAKLKQTIAAQAQEIREALQREAATSEILRVIASSPADLQPVLDTMASMRARLCERTRRYCCDIWPTNKACCHFESEYGATGMEKSRPKQSRQSSVVTAPGACGNRAIERFTCTILLR